MTDRGTLFPQQGVPSYGITDDFPLLLEKAQQFDFAQRLGGCSDPLLAEIDAALRECWEARRAYIEDGGPL